MKPIAIGQRHSLRIVTDDSHTAARFGNDGVAVVATPVLIGFLETTAHQCIRPSFEPGEGSVGIAVNVRHLAASLPGTVVETTAEVTAVKGRQVTFAVEARANGAVIMSGTHSRAIVDLARFFARLGVKAPPAASP